MKTFFLIIAIIVNQNEIDNNEISNNEILKKLENTSFAEIKEKYISILLKRKCPEVIPHIFKYYTENRFEGTLNMTIGNHSARVNLLYSLGVSAIPFLINAIDNKDESNHLIIFDVLTKFKSNSAPAIPSIIKYLNRSHRYAVNAIETFGSIGEKSYIAMPTLLQFKHYPNVILRNQLYKTIEKIGPKANLAIPMLLDALTFENDFLYLSASKALFKIDPKNNNICNVFIKLLKNKNKFIREYAAEFIYENNIKINEAITILLEIINNDPEPSVVLKSAKALDIIDPVKGIELCIKNIEDKSKNVKINAIIALGGFKSKSEEIIHILIGLTYDNDKEIIKYSLMSIGSLEEKASIAIERLLDICLESKSNENFYIAATSIGEIGIASPRVLNLFSNILSFVDEDTEKIIPKAIKTLGMKNQNFHKVVYMLISQIKNDDNKIKFGAIETLTWMDEKIFEKEEKNIMIKILKNIKPQDNLYNDVQRLLFKIMLEN